MFVGEWVDCLAVQGTALFREEGFRVMGVDRPWGCRGRGEGHVRHHLRHAAADALDLLAAWEAYKQSDVFRTDVEGMLPRNLRYS